MKKKPLGRGDRIGFSFLTDWTQVEPNCRCYLCARDLVDVSAGMTDLKTRAPRAVVVQVARGES